MIRVFELFYKLNFSIKNSFTKFMSDFNPNNHNCPSCFTNHADWKKHGIYQRCIISFEKGQIIYYYVNVIRYKCSCCGHTNAILPDIIVPYQSYSLNFILAVLKDYFTKLLTVEAICLKYFISSSTLYKWKKLFLLHKKLWLGALGNRRSSPVKFIDSILELSIPDILINFFKITGISFMQNSFHNNNASSAPP